MPTNKDFYEILGVSKSAAAQEIKNAYRREALKWHPDKNKSSESEKRFKEINEAYQVLSDKEKRAAYDQFGHAAFTPGGNPPPGGFGGFGGFEGGWTQQGPFRVKFTRWGGGDMEGSPFEGFDFSDPFEIFEQFFGGSPFGARSQQPHVSLDVTFEESFRGVEKEFSFQGKRRRVKIPAGVDDGSRIRFSEFLLTINVRPHKYLQREGQDLYADVKVPLLMSISGGIVNIPTVEGDLKIRIRPGTQPGTMLRLSGKGFSRIHGGRGDLYIRLHIDIPDYSKLTREQKEALEKLGKK